MNCQFLNRPDQLGLLKTTNRVNFSAFSHLALQKISDPTYSIKYAINGDEQYVVDGHAHNVKAGQFLIVNANRNMDINIDSEKEVFGLCFHLSEDFLSDIFTHANLSDEKSLDEYGKVATRPVLEEKIFSTRDNPVGKYITSLMQKFDSGRAEIDVDPHEFYYEIANRILLLQRIRARKRAELTVRKAGTSVELQKRLNKAKEMLDDLAEHSMEMELVAREAALSTSHFFRSFRRFYGISPYQYLLRKKMEKAAGLLKQKMPSTLVAEQCGFPDLPSFSKAFKKIYSMPPAKWQRSAND